KYINNNYYNLISKMDLLIKKLLLSGSYKIDLIDNNIYNLFGLEGKYNALNENDYNFTIKGGLNSTTYGFIYLAYAMNNDTPDYLSYNTTRKKYYEFGFEARYKNIYLDACQFSYGSNNISNGNYSIKLLTKNFDFGVNAGYSSYSYYPPIFLKTDIIYHNFFFKNKLDLKLGVSMKYFSNTNLKYFDQNEYDRYIYFTNDGSQFEKDFFNLDFYVGARIGTANVNITVANIFDNLNYTTAIYPYDTRGGFLNTIARFSIVWDFNR
ncbi:MAG: hypothetical protein NTU73_14585, partial [Ignavibacteriae bacterium]|nr:hypothetical protein [Ignavibacteriota bacterium]